MNTVRVFDTTLRDGEQTPGVHITPLEKVEIARRLEAFGVSTIEAGFPISSPGDAEAARLVAKAVRHCEVAAMARCVEADVEAAADSLREAQYPVVHVFLGASDIHLTRKLRMTRAEAIRAIDRSVRAARNRVAAVQFSAEDATRAERPFLRQCVETAILAGATRINLPDTVGFALPEEYAAMIADMVHFVDRSVLVSAHCHNDMGFATANSIAAIRAGARQVEVTVNGIGERAGNASIEEVGVAVHLKQVAAMGLRLEHIAELSAHVAAVTSVPVQPNRPIVGSNAFAHSSGIHQDGIIKDPSSYEFVPPGLVGVPGHRLVFTARSGRNALNHYARQIGFDPAAEQLEAIYQRVIRLAEDRHGAAPQEEVVRVIEATCRQRPAELAGQRPRPDGISVEVAAL
ncbi:MAG: hypothetical protein AMXMBFR84_34050 [Candidatus Hydrogenedentota bacterium]